VRVRVFVFVCVFVGMNEFLYLFVFVHICFRYRRCIKPIFMHACIRLCVQIDIDVCVYAYVHGKIHRPCLRCKGACFSKNAAAREFLREFFAGSGIATAHIAPRTIIAKRQWHPTA